METEEVEDIIVTGSMDNTVKVWNLIDDKLEQKYSMEGHCFGVVSLDINYDSSSNYLVKIFYYTLFIAFDQIVYVIQTTVVLRTLVWLVVCKYRMRSTSYVYDYGFQRTLEKFLNTAFRFNKTKIA